MPRYALDDPHLNRRNLAIMAALCRRGGGEIVLTVAELQQLRPGQDEIEVIADLRAGTVTVRFRRQQDPQALPAPDVPALEGPDD